MATVRVEHDNVALVRRGFEAFGTGDMAALAELFHPDATWHAAPTGVLTGDYRGRDAIFASFAQLHGETGGTFESVPTLMASADGRVFVHANVSGRRKGRTLSSDEVIIFTLVDGTVRDVRIYVGDHDAQVAFWS